MHRRSFLGLIGAIAAVPLTALGLMRKPEPEWHRYGMKFDPAAGSDNTQLTYWVNGERVDTMVFRSGQELTVSKSAGPSSDLVRMWYPGVRS